MTGPDLIAVQRALDARHSKDAAQRESRRLCGLLVRGSLRREERDLFR